MQSWIINHHIVLTVLHMHSESTCQHAGTQSLSFIYLLYSTLGYHTAVAPITFLSRQCSLLLATARCIGLQLRLNRCIHR